MRRIGWEAVVLGNWNRAILSPAGIAQHLFRLEPGTPVEVMVPMAGLEPFKVKYRGTIISADWDRLVVSTETPSLTSLIHDMRIAAHAIEELPKTPLAAAGFNLKYEIEDPPKEFLDLMKCSLDINLSKGQYKIASSGSRRTLEWKDGKINLDIVLGDNGDIRILFNFDRRSTKPEELIEWLNTSEDDIKEVMERLCGVLHIPCSIIQEESV